MLAAIYAKDKSEMLNLVSDRMRGFGDEITGKPGEFRSATFDAFQKWLACPTDGYRGKSYGPLVMFYGILDIPQEKLDSLVDAFCNANPKHARMNSALKATTAELRKKAGEICGRNAKEDSEQAKKDFQSSLSQFRKTAGKGELYGCPASLLSAPLNLNGKGVAKR